MKKLNAETNKLIEQIKNLTSGDRLVTSQKKSDNAEIKTFTVKGRKFKGTDYIKLREIITDQGVAVCTIDMTVSVVYLVENYSPIKLIISHRPFPEGE